MTSEFNDHPLKSFESREAAEHYYLQHLRRNGGWLICLPAADTRHAFLDDRRDGGVERGLGSHLRPLS